MEDEEKMQALYVPAYGDCLPKRIEISAGRELSELQRLVGGNIEPLDIYKGSTIWLNDDGLQCCIPNRAIFATPWQEEQGFLSQLDFMTPVKTGDLYAVLFGDLVILGNDGERSRSLTESELKLYEHYFTEISEPMSGIGAVIAIRTGGIPEAGRIRTDEGKFRSLEDFGGKSSAIRAESRWNDVSRNSDTWLDELGEEDRF